MKKSDLLFYEIMNYPIPNNWEYFSTEKIKDLPNYDNKKFSRQEKNPLIDDYCNQITKHEKIFKSLPWIGKIYLCNSITFNSLKKESDIDLFIVTKKGCLWRARFFSALILFFLGIKRSKKNKNKKYCLSFYVTEEYQNLYNISLPKTDIYLSYRLAHLVPIYQEKTEKETIYTKNNRLFSILPNLPIDYHTINIGTKIYQGKTKIKSNIEKYIGGFFGKIVEILIKIIRIPILIYKTKKLKANGKNIIFNNNMLKFYQDERKKISLLYRTKKTQ